jgi:hypothetical protein
MPWALITIEALMVLVALGGGTATLVRAKGLGTTTAALLGVGCLLLILVAAFDVYFWLAVFPDNVEEGGFESAARLSNVGTLASGILLAVGVALILAGAHTGRRLPAAVAHPQPVGYPTSPPPAAVQPVPPPAAAPAAGGWTPPRQAQSSEWGVMSGVWSIPRGTFDDPPQPGPLSDSPPR